LSPGNKPFVSGVDKTFNSTAAFIAASDVKLLGISLAIPVTGSINALKDRIANMRPKYALANRFLMLRPPDHRKLRSRTHRSQA
jgi:hypothetical protein